MILLAIDTATEMCSAALWVDGKVYHRSTIQPRMHAELILPFVDEILAEAKITKKQIQGLIVGQGPGAFTGVRIGVGVAQGLALALNIPIAPVSNLQTLAFKAYQELNTSQNKTILVATDARMNEVYWAKYQFFGNEVNQISAEKVSMASKVDLTNIDAYIGNGFSVYDELVSYAQTHKISYQANVYTHAKDMLLMVKNNFNNTTHPAELVVPVYLRSP